VPLYLKDHSYGEYIFDWGWAQAAHSAGLDYYPKVVSAVPFTPVTGRRLLVQGNATAGPVVDALVAGVRAVAQRSGASSIHWLFCTAAEQRALARDHGFSPRLTHQYHWHNRGWRDFDDYLAAFRSSARKNVRRERERVRRSGIEVVVRSGDALVEREWEALWRFYRDTTSRKWGQAYLNQGFFETARQTLARRAIATLAYAGERPLAGTLGFHKGDHLYGRYWGCLEQVDGLHFELCYYRPIELCIERGWTRFEAGAQGEHKIKRGLLPVPTHSAHWLRHAPLARAIDRFLERESMMVQYEITELARQGPFKRAGVLR
jgi:predicted N-acyltransferase